jgi:hypothetical protein
MSFLTWLRSEDRSDPAERRRGHGPARRRATARPRLELLEDRRLPSTLTVTSIYDNLYSPPGDGTLRGEIASAQPGDTIIFAPGLNTITLSGFELEINKNLTIQGPGAGSLAISGGSGYVLGTYYGSRVFQVDAGANVTISGLTIEGGNGSTFVAEQFNANEKYDGYGGGILNLGMLALSGCNVTGNTIDTRDGLGYAFGTPPYYAKFGGGGIFNDGTMTLSGCNVTGNSVPPYIDGYGNAWWGAGGGILNWKQSHLNILSSVVLNNSAYASYGGDGDDICDLGWMKISKDSTVGQVSHK